MCRTISASHIRCHLQTASLLYASFFKTVCANVKEAEICLCACVFCVVASWETNILPQNNAKVKTCWWWFIVCDRCRVLFTCEVETPSRLFTLTDSLIINQPCNYTAEWVGAGGSGRRETQGTTERETDYKNFYCGGAGEKTN